MEAFRAEVAEITSFVKAAALPTDIEDTVVWCLKQLPAKYDQFLRHVREQICRRNPPARARRPGEVDRIAFFPPESLVAEKSVLQHLRLLNERYSLPGLVPKPLRPARVRSGKKAS
jgi:hypothetical protein